MESGRSLPSLQVHEHWPLRVISGIADCVIFTKSSDEIAENPEKLLSIFGKLNKKNKIKSVVIENPQEALTRAREILGKDGLVVVTGSLYLVGDVI